MSDGEKPSADLSDVPELSSAAELSSVAEMSPVSDLFPDADLCIAELSPVSELLLPLSADLTAALELAMLDTSRELVLWSGTAVGGADVKPLSIRNTSSTETMCLSMEIADGAVFQVSSLF